MQYKVCVFFVFLGGGWGVEAGALQDLISDFNIYFERHHMMIIRKGLEGGLW